MPFSDKKLKMQSKQWRIQRPIWLLMALLLVPGIVISESGVVSGSCKSEGFVSRFFWTRTTISTSKHTAAAVIPAPIMAKIGHTSVTPSADEPTLNSGSQLLSFMPRKWCDFNRSNIPDSCRLIILKEARYDQIILSRVGVNITDGNTSNMPFK